MSPDQWGVAWQLFYAAAELPPSERRSFLDSASNDPAVVRQVLLLLEDSDKDAEPLPPVTRSHTQVSHYRVGERIGKGGMGEVYSARDMKLDRTVALKFLSSHELGTDSVKRLIREAKAASALNHPNIVTVHEVIESESELAIVMELVDGVSLRSILGTPLPLPKLVSVGRQIAEALSAAHARGIIHRDIKPENIMVREDGYVKLLDFGLARHTDAGQSSNGGMAAGTLRYMSPEQARGDKVTAATDIFSLGVVLYECATGRHPFSGESPFETAHHILTVDAPSPTKVRPDFSPKLERLLLAMLSKDASARPSAQAVLEELNSLPAQQPSVSGPLTRARARWRGKERWIGALSVLLVCGLAAWYWLGLGAYRLTSRSGGREFKLRPRVIPITSFPGTKSFASFSPDGNQIAFAWNGNSGSSQLDLYVKMIGAGDPLRLTSAPEDDFLPAWSPDGRFIAFSRRIDGVGNPLFEAFSRRIEGIFRQAIYVIPALGGSERKITDAGLGISWSPDGKWLALARRPKPEGSGAIFLLSLETGEQKEITNPESYDDSFPAFSLDGNWIAFTRTFMLDSREIFVVSARGGSARQLTFDKASTKGVAWTSDSRQIVFSSNRNGGSDALWRISASGGTPEPVSLGLRGATFPTTSRRGDRLAYTELTRDVNIYQYDSPGFGGRTTPSPFGARRILIRSSHEDTNPSFSPDGSRIAFRSERSGSPEIWTCDRTGRRLTQLTSFRGPHTGAVRWSHDEHFLVFQSHAAGNAEIFTIPADGGAVRRLTFERSWDGTPTWSADGRWIYFISNRSGTSQVWKIPSDGGSAVQVTQTGAKEAETSPDGKLLYFTKWERGIWSVSTEGGLEKPISGLGTVGLARSLGVLKQGIYFVSEEEPLPVIYFYSFQTRKLTPLLRLDQELYRDLRLVTLSPDGRSLLFARLDHEMQDIMLIEEFR